MTRDAARVCPGLISRLNPPLSSYSVNGSNKAFSSDSLADWLAYLERLHPKTIEMGLERVAAVREAMGLTLRCPVITVGGTNGKGSTCAMLESILAAAGYRVGCYTSPHLLRYNERVRVNGRLLTDEELVEGFRAVEAGRGQVALTYFEFGTLAAVWSFARTGLDAVILEVGLGGRLDAVNAFDADCAILTSVDLDHMDYLGDTREAIGKEKAGIFRAGRPAVCGEPELPSSVVQYAESIGARLLRIGQDFGFEPHGDQWRFWGPHGERRNLPYPSLRGAYQLYNAAAGLAALEELQAHLPVTQKHVRDGLLEVALPARFQVLPGFPQIILDVAHNPHGAAALASNLRSMPRTGRTLAVFSMLADKDIPGVAAVMRDVVDQWFVAGLPEPRGGSSMDIMKALAASGIAERACAFESLREAFGQACIAAAENDRILIFGSFHTVAALMECCLGGSAARTSA